MADPVSVVCAQDVWTLVATNVTAGYIKRLSKRPNLYLENYRMTGAAAPTLRTEGIPIFIGKISEEIQAAAAIDVYIMAINGAGLVRVDIP